jgi:hypothetical protein
MHGPRWAVPRPGVRNERAPPTISAELAANIQRMKSRTWLDADAQACLTYAEKPPAGVEGRSKSETMEHGPAAPWPLHFCRDLSQKCSFD